MYPRKTMADFLGDRVIYRNLAPCDPSLPRLADVWQDVGLETFRIPRKTEPVYAAAVYRFLQTAQQQRGLPPLTHLLFVGDTPMNDGTSARNLGEYLPMRGFIGADRLSEPRQVKIDGPLMLANRWQALGDFLEWVREAGFPLNEQTALLLDLDKTTLGPRGRNDKVIDRARINAVRLTVEELLGDCFDEDAFRGVYDRLNQLQYHPFTRDNQDYLAYISLMAVGQIYPADRLWDDLDSGRLTGFHQFVTLCDARQRQMSDGLLSAHREVVTNLAKKDPTPFKSFRYREYHTTVALMDILPDDTPEADLLAGEITLAGEVVEISEQLASQGVLTFGLSDKPDEASLPRPEDAANGALPLHKITMKVVGGLGD
ncbi:MAG: hypothetical protein D6784_00780 [Chloroflexi bacterium]|nr:MAG: hypothetical protein D6784_00780 [Chloroflexota bacterium]